MTPFRFEHLFRAPSTAALFEAYFDPRHQAEQDARVDIVERHVLELDETAHEVRRVCRVVPRRQLPAFVRPLVSGQLHYMETVRWRRAADELDLEIRPSILRGRSQITACYRVSPIGDGLIRRIYEGAVSVDVALLSARIERGIVAEFERSMPVATACTQGWLDRADRSGAARA